MPAISQNGRPSQNRSKPRNSVDVEAGVGHLAGVVEVDGDLGVALDARHRVDDDALRPWIRRLACSFIPKRR